MTPKKLDTSLRAELRAIQWFTLTHAAGLLMFGLLMGAFFWYLHRVEEDQQRQALYRDIEWTQQSIRLKMRETQEEIMAAAPDWALPEGIEDSRAHARDFLARHPALAYVAFVDRDRRVRWLLAARGVPGTTMRAPGNRIDDSAGYGAFYEARDERRPSYSSPFLGDENELLVELHVPALRDSAFVGALVAGYSLSRLISADVTPEVRERYQIALTDQGGNVLVSSSPRRIHEANLGYELPLDPPGRGVRLRAYVFDSRPRLLERSLLLAVIGLSLASTVSLALLWRHARGRLHAEAERDRLFRLSGDLMCILAPDGHLLRVNPAFRSMFGAQAGESDLLRLTHPDDRPTIARALARASAREPAAADVEARFGHDENWHWLQWTLRGDPEGADRSLYGVAHDVTERKAAETALAAETSFRQAMEDSMLTGMRAFDMQGRIIYVNRAFCEMTGYESTKLVGCVAPYPYWPTDDYADQYRLLEMVLSGHAPASGFEVKVTRRDGTVFDARMYVSPLVDRDGRQTGWMSSITDITEPKRIRGALAAAHERFTTVLDELDAAIWVLPSGGEIAGDTSPLFANRAFRSLFGEHPASALALAGDPARADGGMPYELFEPSLGRWIEVRSRAIRWVDGGAARMLMASDVTRRHEAEQRQREQDEKLSQTSRLVTMGEMASSLAHELNQPLTAIANYCMGLAARLRSRQSRGEPIDLSETLGMLGKTAAQAERAGMVIRRIRGFVKRSEPERRRCDVAAIVADAVGLADIEARRRDVRIDVRMPASLPSLVADPILIEQVLLNLIRNGLDALSGESQRLLELDVRLERDAMLFSVIDSGTGLAPGALDKLFQPFYTTKPEGMGMGLNICRSIVESHKGHLWVEDRPGGGTIFRFTLPIPDQSDLARAA